MLLNYLIIITIWLLGCLLFIFATPKHKKREFILAYFICHTLTWLSNLLHLEFDLFTFPVREFPKATDMLLARDFFYPVLCGFYIIYKPKFKNISRFFYLSAWISILVFIEVILVLFTDLISYIHYAWYWAWLVYFSIFAISNAIFNWFFNNVMLEEEVRIIR